MSRLVEFLNALAAVALSVLPDSPFRGFIDGLGAVPYIGYLNYFVPISDFLTLLAVWGTAIGLFYAVSAILRFVNVID